MYIMLRSLSSRNEVVGFRTISKVPYSEFTSRGERESLGEKILEELVVKRLLYFFGFNKKVLRCIEGFGIRRVSKDGG